MFDADYNMSTSSQGRDKAKEEEQYKSVHKLLDQGKAAPDDHTLSPDSVKLIAVQS